ncbi:MAG: amino acid ABC transporter [Ahrensia sp.]|nr:amino acid ABC transporter [Ahrensia sp.]
MATIPSQAKARTRSGIALMCAAASVVAVACSSGGDTGEDAPTTGAISAGGENLSGEPIKFGFLNGITGAYAQFAPAALNGAEVAIKDINVGGGINGRPVELIIQDNKSTPEGAVSGYNKLVDADQVLAIGGIDSDAVQALLKPTSEQHMPTICSFCGTTALDKAGGDFMWRVAPSDSDIGIATAQYARDAGLMRMSGMAQKTEGSLSGLNSFTEVYTGPVGGEMINEVQFDSTKSTFQSEVQQATEGDPDAIYLSMGPSEALSMLREWQRRGADGNFIMSMDLTVPEVAEFDFLTDGRAVGLAPGYDKTTPSFEHFAKRLMEEKNTEPHEGLGEPNYYDTFIVLALAATAAGDDVTSETINAAIPTVVNEPGAVCYIYTECADLLKAGEEIDYQGASGDLQLNEFGNLDRPLMTVIGVKDGAWVAQETLELDPTLRK